MDTHQALVTLLAERSAKHGRFVLSSGRVSDLYIDARLTTMSPEGLQLIGLLGLETIRASFGNEAQSIGGMTLGADPIAYAIAYASASTPHPLRAFTVRKEAKGHGTGRQVEGPFQSGDQVVVVEDVITTGASALKAVEVLRQHSAKVLGVLALVDREEGGRQVLEDAGLVVHVLVQAAELIRYSQPQPTL